VVRAIIVSLLFAVCLTGCDEEECCKNCCEGQPCGDSCISSSDTCSAGSGCACGCDEMYPGELADLAQDCTPTK